MDIVVERRRGPKVDELTFPATTQGLERAMSRLNGADTTIVTIEGADRRMFVGGGPACFTVSVWLPMDEMYQLVGDPSRAETLKIMLGGQLTPVPARHCVGLERARIAAREFLATGSITVSSDWERQPVASAPPRLH